jgi:hypothetical protein
MDRKSSDKGHSGIDQAILDDIGAESTDSEIEEEDYLPVSSLYAKSQSRNSSLTRSKSIVSFDTCESSVQVDYNRYSGVNFGAMNTVMPSPTSASPQELSPKNQHSRLAVECADLLVCHVFKRHDLIIIVLSAKLWPTLQRKHQ